MRSLACAAALALLCGCTAEPVATPVSAASVAPTAVAALRSTPTPALSPKTDPTPAPATSARPTPSPTPSPEPAPTPTLKPAPAPDMDDNARACMQKAGLVALDGLGAGWIIDMRYATENNFIGKVLYTGYGAFLREDAAAKLLMAQTALEKQGYTLVILDAYRPRRYQQVLWDAVDDKQYVADPKNASRHNRGGAVDVTLAYSGGEPAPMPSGFDEFTERAHRNYKGASDEEKKNADALTKAMRDAGFTTISNEWWHYDDADWRSYGVLDVDFR